MGEFLLDLLDHRLDLALGTHSSLPLTLDDFLQLVQLIVEVGLEPALTTLSALGLLFELFLDGEELLG